MEAGTAVSRPQRFLDAEPDEHDGRQPEQHPNADHVDAWRDAAEE